MALHLHISDEHEDLLRRLGDIGPVLRENADKSEDLGQLTEESAQALRDAGAFRTSIPASLGGYELSPLQHIEVVERIAYDDASAAWAYMALQVATGTTAAWLGDEAVRELYPDVPSGNHALLAGQGTKLGEAVPTEGGYRISGHWMFASGISMATHVHTAAQCTETGKPLVFSLPKEQAELVDNWDVMGLRATASHDYICHDVFVPSSHVYEMTAVEVHHGGAIYRMGMIGMACLCHTGWALGVGRRMLDEMRQIAARKTGTPGATVDTQQFHAEYAEAESRLRAARAWVREVWADNEAALDRGEALTTEQETLARLSLHNATWAVHAVGQAVYKWAGTTALRRGALQRFFRDLHAGTQHVTSGPVVLQSCGKWLSGLAPESQWVFLELQES
jgi:alkylation response protein AidB-like acyl-CoA dehydrogenase